MQEKVATLDLFQNQKTKNKTKQKNELAFQRFDLICIIKSVHWLALFYILLLIKKTLFYNIVWKYVAYDYFIKKISALSQI